jgi:signal transduction histidine kinase/Tfp pilus assembly protein PilF
VAGNGISAIGHTEIKPSQGQERIALLNELSETIHHKEPQLALQYAREAYLLAIEYQDHVQQIKALLNIGDGYYYTKSYDSAHPYYQQALNLGKQYGEEALVAKALYFIACAYDMTNSIDSSIFYYQKSINEYESLDMPERISVLSYLMGALYVKNGNKYKALEAYKKSLAITDSLGNQKESAETLNTIGVMYYTWGNYQKAIEYYNLSLQITRSTNNKAGTAQAVNNLGIVYHDMGNLDEALRYYEQSLQIELDMGEKELQTSYNNIGLIYDNRKQYDKALQYYEKSLAIAEKMDDPIGVSTALNNIGELYAASGQSELAILVMKRSLEIEKQNQDKNGISIAYRNLGEMYFLAGNIDMSQHYNDSSFSLARKMNNPELLQKNYINYYKIFKARGRPDKALAYLEKNIAIKDSLFSENLQQQIADMQGKYELEQKEKEIELLNSKNLLNQLSLKNKQSQLQRQQMILLILTTGIIIILIVLLVLSKQIRQKKQAYLLLDQRNNELERSRRELLDSKEKAEESDRLKSLFLANMSHELRTPLNGILGFTEILRTDLSDADFREMADIIHSSGKRLLDTLNAIIDLSVIESNKTEVHISAIRLLELITDTTLSFAEAAATKQIQLIIDFSDKDTVIYSDKSILIRMLKILINNAIKYTEKGFVKIGAAVTTETAGQQLKLKITDTGIGIPAENLSNIFEKFRQGSEGNARLYEGTGLGLTICRKYVEILDGNIHVESAPRHGSTFTITLPLKKASEISDP